MTIDYDPTMPQSSMPLQMYPQQSMMGNPQYNQLMNAQQAPQQPMQDPMQQYMEQMRRQKAMQMMGQGIANMGRGMQQPMPSGNTAQIMRDQGGPRMQGNQQQMMAQMLRRR